MRRPRRPQFGYRFPPSRIKDPTPALCGGEYRAEPCGTWESKQVMIIGGDVDAHKIISKETDTIGKWGGGRGVDSIVTL